jgi:ribulose-phosphate 3-epimerase
VGLFSVELISLTHWFSPFQYNIVEPNHKTTANKGVTTMSEKDYLISPSILSADFTRLGDQIKQVQDAGADWIHIDVIDGHFAPNITMGPFIVEACRRVTDLPLDVHLMIEKPERYLEAFANAGATNLTVHIETCPDMTRTLEKIHSLGCEAGITLNPATNAVEIQPYLPYVDLVLVMSVNPGFSGQSFMEESLQKIAQIKEMLDLIDSSAPIEVDGGIKPSNIRDTYQQGARVFVAASAIYKHPEGIRAGLQSLTEQLNP